MWIILKLHNRRPGNVPVTRESENLLSQSERERLAILSTYEVVDAKGIATLDNALIITAHVAGAHAAFMAMVDVDRLVFKATYGFTHTQDSFPRAGSFSDHVIRSHGRPMIVADASCDDRFRDHSAVRSGLRFFAGFPVVARNAHVVGVLACLDNNPIYLNPGQIDTLERIAENTMVAFELRRTLYHAHRMALTDTLTGIGNRHAFFETGARFLIQRKTAAGRNSLLYVDLDGFKNLNDTSGHHAGDQALRIVADCLARNIRGCDFAARIGGDEFAILLVDCEDHEIVSERIRDEVRAAMAARGWSVTASVGLLTFHAPPVSMSDAMAASDMLMYQAKNAGKNRVARGVYGSRREVMPA